MISSCVFLLLLVFIPANKSQPNSENDQINQLVSQWAPLIWLAPQEKHFPMGVEPFLKHVHLSDENQNPRNWSLTNSNTSLDSSTLYLVTNRKLETMTESSFLRGDNPNKSQVPIYAVVTPCSPHLSFRSSSENTVIEKINSLVATRSSALGSHFHVSYWTFYPYNKGKSICFLGNLPTPLIFGKCLGHFKTIGSHVGDWEHMSLSFKGKPFPSSMYISVHYTGAYYKFDSRTKLFKLDPSRAKKKIVGQPPNFSPYVRTQNGHPVLYSAEGSHGLWGAPGYHDYVKFPRLTDKCGVGASWKTWEKMQIFHLGTSFLPKWMQYKGKWGNPMSNCFFYKKLGLCEFLDGPPGILRSKDDFYC